MNNSVKKWVTFSVIALGLFSTVMEGSMIGLALPSIASDLFSGSIEGIEDNNALV